MLNHLFNRYRRVSVNAIASFSQAIVVGICYFFLYKYLLKTVGSEELGLWSLVVASSSMAGMGSMGIGGSVVKFVADADAHKDYKKIESIFHTSIVIVLPVIGLLCLILYGVLPGILASAVSKDLYPLALRLIPVALLNFFLNACAGIFCSTIDGLQFIYIRNFIASCLIILYLVLTFIFVPVWGLVGVVYAQIVQSTIMIISYLTVIYIKLPGFNLFRLRIQRHIFKELFNYGVNFQVMSLSDLFFDPITKYFLSRFGGLSVTGFYDMAGKLVSQLRSLIVSSLQVIVPAIANVSAKGFSDIKDLYLKWFPNLFSATLILITSIVAMANYIAVIWVGRREETFIIILILLSIGWFFNIISSFAYFIDLGTGDLKWNVRAHVIQSSANLILGYLFGRLIGGVYVVLAPATALIIGTFILLIPFNKHYQLKFKELFGREMLLLSLIATVCIIGSYALYYFASGFVPFFFLFILNIMFVAVMLFVGILLNTRNTLSLKWNNRLRYDETT